jgi:hypothetical protein
MGSPSFSLSSNSQREYSKDAENNGECFSAAPAAWDVFAAEASSELNAKQNKRTAAAINIDAINLAFGLASMAFFNLNLIRRSSLKVE